MTNKGSSVENSPISIETKHPLEDGLSIQHPESMADSRQRQQALLRKRRSRKKMKVRYHRLVWLLKISLIPLLTYAMVLMIQSPFWTLDTLRFSVKNNQNNLVNAALIKPYLEAYVGRTLFEVDPAEVEMRIRQDYPLVDHVFVRRFFFPTRLEVQVLEKPRWALVYSTSKATEPYGVMGTDFHVYSLQPYPQAKGIQPGGSLVKLVLPPWQRMNIQDLRALQRLSVDLSTVQGLHYWGLDVSDSQMMKAQFAEMAVWLGPLDRTLRARAERILTLVPTIQTLKGKMGVLDLRWHRQVTFHRAPKVLKESLALTNQPMRTIENKPVMTDALQQQLENQPVVTSVVKPTTVVKPDNSIQGAHQTTLTSQTQVVQIHETPEGH
ncbi:MAG: FtsQ-type POTRA domain-containing protein [Cyanobacteria bacterium]|nr:FtsQ-type POTRA domain-containing protein [Cyanobacteriota bacterium]